MALARAGVLTAGDLVGYTEAGVRELRGIGPETFAAICRGVDDVGLALRKDVPKPLPAPVSPYVSSREASLFHIQMVPMDGVGFFGNAREIAGWYLSRPDVQERVAADGVRKSFRRIYEGILDGEFGAIDKNYVVRTAWKGLFYALNANERRAAYAALTQSKEVTPDRRVARWFRSKSFTNEDLQFLLGLVLNREAKIIAPRRKKALVLHVRYALAPGDFATV